MRVSVVGKIYETTNYGMFRFRQDNRVVTDANVNALVKSIKTMGQRHPIAVDASYRVQDGQHRLQACKALGIPVTYIIDEKSMSTNEIAELQHASKKWNNEDYAHSFSISDDNGEDYRLYQEFMKKYPEFSHTIAVMLLVNKTYTNKGTDDTFRTGQFKVKNYSKAKIIAETLKELAQYYNGYSRRGFVLAIMTLLNNPDFNFDRLMRKMPKLCRRLHDFSKTEDYINVLTEIYNWKETKKVYFK